jgi:micrococcal nuclease
MGTVYISWMKNPSASKAFLVVCLITGVFASISIFEMPNESEAQIRCRGTAACFIGNVTKVIDGDTLDVNGIRIRLSLINTPELGMTNFTEAKKLVQVCPIGSVALVDQDDEQKKGIYGRMIGEVYCNYSPTNWNSTKNFSEEMLKSGFAVILTKFCAHSEFAIESWVKKYGC